MVAAGVAALLKPRACLLCRSCGRACFAEAEDVAAFLLLSYMLWYDECGIDQWYNQGDCKTGGI